MSFNFIRFWWNQNAQCANYEQYAHYVQYIQCVQHVQYVQYVQYTQHVQYAQCVPYVQYTQSVQCVQYVQYTKSVQCVQYVQYTKYVQFVQYVQYTHPVQCAQLNLCFIAHISLLLSNQSIPSQITDVTDRQTSAPSAARCSDCVDIASGSVLSVPQWTWYLHAVTSSGQTGRISGKCLFVKGNVGFHNIRIFDHMRTFQLLQKHSAPFSLFVTAVTVSSSFISTVMSVAVQWLCMDLIN